MPHHTIADDLVARILQGSSDLGIALNELHDLIWDGSDPNVLRALLSSGREEIEIGAAWILAEGSPQCAVLLDCALPMSIHSSKRLRAYAVDFIVNQRHLLTDDAKRAARQLLEDADPDVRNYAIEMFAQSGIG